MAHAGSADTILHPSGIKTIWDLGIELARVNQRKASAFPASHQISVGEQHQDQAARFRDAGNAETDVIVLARS
jgi:hypothetical protein